MNKDRRKRLAAIQVMIDEAKTLLEGVAEEERESFDNLSEGLQASERGERMDEVASNLEDMVGSLDEVISGIDEAME